MCGCLQPLADVRPIPAVPFTRQVLAECGARLISLSPLSLRAFCDLGIVVYCSIIRIEYLLIRT